MSENQETEVPVEEPVQTIEYRTFPTTFSDSIGKLAGAVAAAQGAMRNGTKDKEGYGYNYMTLPNLIDISREPLSVNNLAIIQYHELIKGAVPSVVTYTLLAHESGEWMKSSIEMPISQMKQLSPAQMVGVAATYGRRYALQAICKIAAEEDTDAAIQ